MDAPIEAGGVRWWLGGQLPAARAGPLLARALAAVEAGAPELKRGRRKALHRLALSGSGEPDYLLKVNRYEGGRWRRSKARRELARARAVADRGLPTPVPVAAGERRRRGKLEACYLLVAILPGAKDLRERLSREDRPAVRRALAEGLGRLARQMHDAGLHQDDFQPNNFLVRDGAAGPELFVIDFERARLGRRVPRRLRHRALAKLDRELACEPASLRLRFLTAYCGGDRRATRACWRTLAREARALARRDVSHLFRNAARPGRRFEAIRLPDFSGVALPGLAPGRVERAAARAMAAPPDRIAGAAFEDEWTLALARPGVGYARRVLSHALALAARGLAPRPLAVLCGRERSILILERRERTLQASEVRRNASVEAACRVLERRLAGYGRLRRPLRDEDLALLPAGPGRVRAMLLGVEAFALRRRFGGRGGSAGRSR